MRTETLHSETLYDWRRDGWLAACSLTAVVLVISAAIPHAPGFDTFLRLFVFGVAVVRGFVGFRQGGAWLPLSAAAIALLFNPAAPMPMSPTAWTLCDVLAAGWFALVGAWQLLRFRSPQRGWAAVALSVVALIVPAVGSLTMTNRDALTAPNLNENLAVMNAPANAAAPAPQVAESTGPAPVAQQPASSSDHTDQVSVAPHAAATAEQASASDIRAPVPASPPVLNAPAFAARNKVTAPAEQSADDTGQTSADTAPSSEAPGNNETGANRN